MLTNNVIATSVREALSEGMALTKCRQCGCMQDTLEMLSGTLKTSMEQGAPALSAELESWKKEMAPVRYACLGCELCYPAVALNRFAEEFPQSQAPEPMACSFEVEQGAWPLVPGEYRVLCADTRCPVAVSTLGSVGLVERIAERRPQGLCIVGKTETENIGIDKIIKNTISHPALRTLIVAGIDPQGHFPGQTLESLMAHGVDQEMRVVGSKGRRPHLRNVTRAEVEAFRAQVTLVDMIGCEDVQAVIKEIQKHTSEGPVACSCAHCSEDKPSVAETSDVTTVLAAPPGKVQMDKAGYFVVLPEAKNKRVVVEHYSYDDRLLRRIEGTDARSLYSTIITNGWVTQLSHAAYLGKELEKAELSLTHGFVYVQDGA